MVRIAHRKWLAISVLPLLAALSSVMVVLATGAADPPAPTRAVPHVPPPVSGYFATTPVGSWSSLPSGRRCAERVHRSTWEPRPDNEGPNQRMPAARQVRAALAARPVALENAYDLRWDTWLLPRVTGRFTGTTDEIIQWGACKWGISDNVLRAVAVRESTWYQHEVYESGACVVNFGCGDLLTSRDAATDVFCDELARHGRDFRSDHGAGLCPRTFGLTGVMSWQHPDWGRMPGNQNGTYPFNRSSTAFAVDYLASQLRGCHEGWQTWLGNTGTGEYAPGRLWGCVGAWYAGEWLSPDALGYVDRVRDELAARTWLSAEFARARPACDARLGCPQGS